MSKFTWKDNVVIDFGDGVSFEVPNDANFVVETVGKANDNVQKVADKNPEDGKAALNAMLDAIDAILGDGATGRIFDGHALSPRNVLAAYLFIVNEILTQVNGYDELMDDLTQLTKQFGNTPSVSDEAKQAAFDKAKQLGVDLHAVPTTKPRL